ncbi:MAG: hypothetical protein FWF18_05060 [Dehalococcoidia bacterium]|jgi:hypothetical protein|nr:hypothetical protein [Dehalococcoidia bacterium]
MVNKAKKVTEARTTVGVKQSTKDSLDRNRAPGQCYDGFIHQLVDLWEKTKSDAGFPPVTTKPKTTRKRKTEVV